VRSARLIFLLVIAAFVCAGGLAVAAAPTFFTLNVNAAGDGSGVIHGSSIDCAPTAGKDVGPCTINESAGNSVTLTATANRGSVFDGWSGDGCSGTGACTVVMNQNITLTARFTLSRVSAPKVRTLLVSTSHRTSLPLTCHGPGSCVGTVQLTTTTSNGTLITAASSNYTIAAGSRRSVQLTISGRALALAAKNHQRLRATAIVAPNDGQPQTWAVTLKFA
jgi:Divergent InlB B-repeat domain